MNLEEVRRRMLGIIELNPHNYEQLQSYRRLRRLELKLVAVEYPRVYDRVARVWRSA